MSLNVCFFIGNLTRDVELRYTPKGTAVAEIGLAVNKVWYDDNKTKHEDVTFLNLVAWGRTAEIAEEFLKKGDSAHFTCEVKMESWDDKQTGNKRTALKFTVNQLTLTGGNKRASREEPPPPPRPPQRKTYGAPPPTGRQRAKQEFHDPDLDGPAEPSPFGDEYAS